MYGEEDYKFVPFIMKVSQWTGRQIPKLFGQGGKHQPVYAGELLPLYLFRLQKYYITRLFFLIQYKSWQISLLQLTLSLVKTKNNTMLLHFTSYCNKYIYFHLVTTNKPSIWTEIQSNDTSDRRKMLTTTARNVHCTRWDRFKFCKLFFFSYDLTHIEIETIFY